MKSARESRGYKLQGTEKREMIFKVLSGCFKTLHCLFVLMCYYIFLLPKTTESLCVFVAARFITKLIKH